MPEEQGPPSPAAEGTAGDLAIVLHSHMPYVEGFGTYPFGEEWLHDAVIRSYLPVLEVADRLTMTVTPVLADQLEDEGVQERLRAFLVEHRIGAADLDLEEVDDECVPAARAEAERWRHALELLDAAGGSPLRAFQDARASGRVALAGSAATHAVLPLLATRQGLRLQLDAGLRSHRRRFGSDGGFWLPECAYEPGLEWDLAEQGVEWFCVDQSRHPPPLDALAPVSTEAGPTALPIDWEAVSWLWSLDGYPSDPGYAQFAGRSLRGLQIWSIGGPPYDPEVAQRTAERQAAEFLSAVAERLRGYSTERDERGLLVFAIDTELLGHWWREGPTWLRGVIEGAEAAGVRMVTVPEALAAHEPVARPLKASSWGEGKSLRTWDSPLVADIAWATRRSELRLLQAVRSGLPEDAALRATRELLALQSSDWAFLDGRMETGDYPFQRSIGHSQALLEAIDSERVTDRRMRSLAPDLSLAPLLEP